MDRASTAAVAPKHDVTIVYGETQDAGRLGCTVYALSAVTGCALDAATAIVDETRRPRQWHSATSSKVIEAAKEKGYAFKKLRMKPRTLARFLREHPTGRYYLRKRGHAFAVVDGVVFDRINSGASVRIKDAWEYVGRAA